MASDVTRHKLGITCTPIVMTLEDGLFWQETVTDVLSRKLPRVNMVVVH